MKLEILLAAMNQTDFSLVEESHITSDVIIINQTDHVSYEEKQYGDFTARMYSFNEVGVGRSRNDALMRSQADICLVADDDMVYVPDYETIILNEFEKAPEADMIIFDVNVIEDIGFNRVKSKNERVTMRNLLNHGAPQMAFRRKSILRKNIFFSLLFGGGAKYSSGEDTLFLKEILDSGLNVISVDKKIADIYNADSSWFEGFTEKLAFDRGALFKALYPKTWPRACAQFIRDYYGEYSSELSRKELYLKMAEGARDFEK